MQLAPPPQHIEPVKTNSGVPNSGNCKHSVPCGDRVWLTRAKDQEGVQPTVFSLSESVSNVKVLLATDEPCFQETLKETDSGAIQTSVKALTAWSKHCNHMYTDPCTLGHRFMLHFYSEWEKPHSSLTILWCQPVYTFISRKTSSCKQVKWIQKVCTVNLSLLW